MQFSVQFDVGDTVIDKVTGQMLTVTGIRFRTGLFEDQNYSNCIGINTIVGVKGLNELKKITQFDNYLIDSYSV